MFILIKRPVNDTLWSTLNACQIIEVVLGLEMKVHESLLNLHKCASGTYGTNINVQEDPHVN